MSDATNKFKLYLNSILNKIDGDIHNELWNHLIAVIKECVWLEKALSPDKKYLLLIKERRPLIINRIQDEFDYILHQDSSIIDFIDDNDTEESWFYQFSKDNSSIFIGDYGSEIIANFFDEDGNGFGYTAIDIDTLIIKLKEKI